MSIFQWLLFELFGKIAIFSVQCNQPLFILANLSNELAIGSFSGQELLGDVFDIVGAWCVFYCLESFFYLISSSHFCLHFRWEELGPELLDHIVLLHFDFIWIFIVICRLLCDLLLSVKPKHSSLSCFLLILKGFFNTNDLLRLSFSHFSDLSASLHILLLRITKVLLCLVNINFYCI